MAELFQDATNRKGSERQRGEESRVNKNGDVILGKWGKYQQGWSYVTPHMMYVFWCAKWETTLFGDIPVRTFSQKEYVGKPMKDRCCTVGDERLLR